MHAERSGCVIGGVVPPQQSQFLYDLLNRRGHDDHTSRCTDLIVPVFLDAGNGTFFAGHLGLDANEEADRSFFRAQADAVRMSLIDHHRDAREDVRRTRFHRGSAVDLDAVSTPCADSCLDGSAEPRFWLRHA